MDNLFQAEESGTPAPLNSSVWAAEFLTPVPLESSVPAPESLAVVPLQSSADPNKMTISDDQLFLLIFIMGTYFGPDLKEENPKKSAFQRMAEGLPPYTSDQLTGSHLKTAEVERVYYYVLKKADDTLIVKLPLLQHFFQGNLFINTQDPSASHRQFTDLFPPHLHPQSRLRNRYPIIENVIFINHPEISYIKSEDVERFKRLTGLENLLLNKTARLYSDSRFRADAGNDITPKDLGSNGKLQASTSARKSRKRQRSKDHRAPNDALPPVHNVTPVSRLPYGGTLVPYSIASPASKTENVEKVVGPAILFYPSHPTAEEWNYVVASNKTGVALTGSVAERVPGPILGLVDIGVSDDAYIFRVSLPGVKKEEKAFSCEVETDGRVMIRGVTTTGEKTVLKYAQVFEMKTQYLCPPGDFSVSFRLPGPVEPQKFGGTFGADGILEGVVMKQGSKRK